MENNERWAIDCKIGVGNDRGFKVLNEGIEGNEKLLFLRKRLEKFQQNKAGCYFGAMNARFRKDVYRKLADLLNEVSFVCQKKQQDCLLDKVYLWYLGKVGVCGNEELNRERGTEKIRKYNWGGDDGVGVKVEGRRKLEFSTLRPLEIKYREQKVISDLLINRKNRRNCASFSPEPESCWKLIGKNNFSCYNRGRSLEIRELKTEQKKLFDTDLIPKNPGTNLKISGDLIMKLSTVQESAKKCFLYSRRIFRKK